MNAFFRVSGVTAACALAFGAYASEGVVSGRVVGHGYYANARVCLDLKESGRCDSDSPSAITDASGSFVIRGPRANSAGIVAELGMDATLTNPLTGVTTRVTRPLTFRSHAGSYLLVGPVSTELEALTEDKSGDARGALDALSTRLGVSGAQVSEDPNLDANNAVGGVLFNESDGLIERIADAREEAGHDGDLRRALRNRLALDRIDTVIVIYAENRSFDNLFGHFPEADGLETRAAKRIVQLDRDDATALPMLPPAWNGLTAPGQTPVVTQAQTTNVWPNAPFAIDEAVDRFGYGVLPNSIVTRDLYHRFFENQMQIDGGRNDQFAAWGDSGGLVMGHFDGRKTDIWSLARRYTLADHFFQAAYGGSFLNHQYLICACAPSIPAALVTANHISINTLAAPVNGVVQLASNPSQTASALAGPPSLKTGNVAPLDYFGSGDGYRAVNTMQPPFQPSGNTPVDASGSDGLFANPAAATTVPPQTQTTIGDLLSARSIDWTWYSGGWAAAVANPYPFNTVTNSFGASTTIYDTNSFGTADSIATDFQAHHQPFNYYAALDPVLHTAYRAAHLRDRSDLVNDAERGTLPAVSFYKPVGFLNEHPGYASLTEGDAEISTIVSTLQHSPQWPHMLILVTYDEFGGQFDHVAPPKGDLLGPGTRIPAVVISPFAKRGFVDHTPYDTASYLRFITHRFSLPELKGLKTRDDALVSNGARPMGDLTNALELDSDRR